MDEAEWAASPDPDAMLRWLSRQGRMDVLWDFAVRCGRYLYEDLPGSRFRRVVELADNRGRGLATWEMVDEALHRASRAMKKLIARYRDSDDTGEQERLNRQIGAGNIVWVFEFQDGYEAALAASHHLIEWAAGAEEERIRQAALIRQLVPDPSQASEPEA